MTSLASRESGKCYLSSKVNKTPASSLAATAAAAALVVVGWGRGGGPCRATVLCQSETRPTLFLRQASRRGRQAEPERFRGKYRDFTHPCSPPTQGEGAPTVGCLRRPTQAKEAQAAFSEGLLSNLSFPVGLAFPWELHVCANPSDTPCVSTKTAHMWLSETPRLLRLPALASESKPELPSTRCLPARGILPLEYRAT